MKTCIVLALLASGCTVERDVLSSGEVTTCGDAFLAETGQACSLAMTCMRDAPDNPTCCTDSAYCRAGSLVVDHECNPDCTPCTTDAQCVRGAAICTNLTCEPCPASNTACSTPCPNGWVRLHRNGCPTCECAPAPTCNDSGGSPTACANGVCYDGAECAPGCVPNDPGCCSNQCAMVGCPGPIPVGCLAACSTAQTNAGCSTCATQHCDCVGGAWQCTTTCANGVHAACVAP